MVTFSQVHIEDTLRWITKCSLTNKKKKWALHKLPDHSEIKLQINNIMKTRKFLNNWILNNTVLNNISQIHNFEKQAKYVLS